MSHSHDPFRYFTREELAEYDRMAACKKCRGVGWYIATNGSAQMCREHVETKPG